MILPSKHLPPDRALLTVGATVLKLLVHPRTVSALWEDLNWHDPALGQTAPRMTYDWFLLSLSLLYTFGSIELQGGLVTRRTA